MIIRTQLVIKEKQIKIAGCYSIISYRQRFKRLKVYSIDEVVKK